MEPRSRTIVAAILSPPTRRAVKIFMVNIFVLLFFIFLGSFANSAFAEKPPVEKPPVENQDDSRRYQNLKVFSNVLSAMSRAFRPSTEGR